MKTLKQILITAFLLAIGFAIGVTFRTKLGYEVAYLKGECAALDTVESIMARQSKDTATCTSLNIVSELDTVTYYLYRRCK